MALGINLPPYTIESVRGGDNYLTHYSAVDEQGENYIITEFYPAYMTTREDDGTLTITERFITEFAKDLEEFMRRGQTMMDTRDISFIPIEAVIEENNTAYIVRKTCTLIPVESYMSDQTMDFDEAYVFIRPLLISLAEAASQGLAYKFDLQDVRISSYRTPVLDSIFSWSGDFLDTISNIMALYFRLLSGTQPSPGVTDPAAYGISVPPRIMTMLRDALSGEMAYGSMDDFYKNFKSIIEIVTAPVEDTSGKTNKLMQNIIIALCFLVMASFGGLIYGFVGAHRAGTFWADPEIFASDEVILPYADFSAFTLTHPRNISDPVEGTFLIHGYFIFSRSVSNGKPAISRRRLDDVLLPPGVTGPLAADGEEIILENVRASFMIGYEDYIFFVDGLSNHRVYRMELNGDNVQRISDTPALHIAYINGFLYYANMDDNGFLYRLHIPSGADQFLMDNPIHGMISRGEFLYFIAGGSVPGLFVLDTETGGLTGLTGLAAGGLNMIGDFLYFIDFSGFVRRISIHGVLTDFISEVPVYAYAVSDRWFVFTEPLVHQVRAYDRLRSRLYTLSNTDWVSSLYIAREQDLDIVYGICHSDANTRLVFDLP